MRKQIRELEAACEEVPTWYAVAVGLLIAAASVILQGCSFKTEIGYHGLTGRDDRTQTQLITEQKRELNKVGIKKASLPSGGY